MMNTERLQLKIQNFIGIQNSLTHLIVRHVTSSTWKIINQLMMVVEIIQLVAHQHSSHFIVRVVKKLATVICLKDILILCVKALCILRHILVTICWTKQQQVKTIKRKHQNKIEGVRTATITKDNFWTLKLNSEW